ncbi:hypothetical protein HY772_09840 [Candidatus Woesearchaeota archaeon]|nr:hypothetical protein [Candidatus Woesearchaeota archaeon]
MTYSSLRPSYQIPSLLERNVLQSVAEVYSSRSGAVFVQSPGADISHSINAVAPDQNVYRRIGMSEKKKYVLNLDARLIETIPHYIGSFQERVSAPKTYRGSHDGQYLKAQQQYNLMIADKYKNIITAGLLREDRPLTQFIEDAREVETFVKETFEKVTGQIFPGDIVVWVCSEENLMKAHVNHGGVWNPGIQGFAINKKIGARRIFVRKNHLDALMLVIGHEIGHVLTEQLPNPLDEEAKAFAFEIAWVKAIIEHDIAGLKASFNVNFTPAANGLHNVAFSFVQKKVKTGKGSLDLYWDLVRRTLAVEQAQAA